MCKQQKYTKIFFATCLLRAGRKGLKKLKICHLVELEKIYLLKKKGTMNELDLTDILVKY